MTKEAAEKEECFHRWDLTFFCPCGCGQGMMKCRNCKIEKMFIAKIVKTT